ncbi:hypothetical protein EDB82DRAFT_238216 [Fusarium venenatum]|uniref:uncharacterized protein n=1 Tax=Fusarium venenatum TaxID=56646 RepID=UPI001D8E7FB3|nr:hypothetical protein EDB82DRAFT_238216 [Fusarium venenatum]
MIWMRDVLLMVLHQLSSAPLCVMSATSSLYMSRLLENLLRDNLTHSILPQLNSIITLLEPPKRAILYAVLWLCFVLHCHHHHLTACCQVCSIIAAWMCNLWGEIRTMGYNRTGDLGREADNVGV